MEGGAPRLDCRRSPLVIRIQTLAARRRFASDAVGLLRRARVARRIQVCFSPLARLPSCQASFYSGVWPSGANR